MSTAFIWQQYIDGDNQILRDLYQPLFRNLYLTAYKFTRNEEVASDLVQDLFVSLLYTPISERQKKWNEIQNIDAFLITFIKCKALDWYKVQQNRKRILSENVYINDREELSESEEQFEKLNDVINLLSGKEQELIRLHLAGYKNDEIAVQRNQSEKSIRNRLSESRKKIITLWKSNYLFILILSWIN